MSVVELSIAAATAILDFNLMQNSTYRQSSRARNIRSMALTGSAAAGDSAVALKIGNIEVARKFNSATGFPTRDHLVPVNRTVPANSEIGAIVVDAPATNPLNLLLVFDD